MGHIAWSKSTAEGKPPGRAKLGLIFAYGSLALIPVIAAIAGLTAPLVIRQRQKADQAQCVNHVKQIGLTLYQYKQEKGNYPSDLRQLENEGYTTSLDALLRLRPTYAGEWLYFPDRDPRNSPNPLLVSPKIGNKIIMLHESLAVSMESPGKLPNQDTNGESQAIPIPAPTAR